MQFPLSWLSLHLSEQYCLRGEVLFFPRVPHRSGALEARGRGVTLGPSPGERKSQSVHALVGRKDGRVRGSGEILICVPGLIGCPSHNRAHQIEIGDDIQSSDESRRTRTHATCRNRTYVSPPLHAVGSLQALPILPGPPEDIHRLTTTSRFGDM